MSAALERIPLSARVTIEPGPGDHIRDITDAASWLAGHIGRDVWFTHNGTTVRAHTGEASEAVFERWALYRKAGLHEEHEQAEYLASVGVRL